MGQRVGAARVAGVSDESRPGKTQAEFGPRLGSGRETFVAMMKSTDLREGNDLAWTRRLEALKRYGAEPCSRMLSLL